MRSWDGVTLNKRCPGPDAAAGRGSVLNTILGSMSKKYSSGRLGLAVLAGGLAFVGTADATELIVDGSFENAAGSSNPLVKVGGVADPGVGQGWSSFSTYLYSTQYTLPGPVNSGAGFLRPYPSGTYGITQSSTEAKQTVSLTAGTTLTPAKIDAGQGTFTMSAWFSSYLTQGDYSDLTLEFLDDADQVVGEPLALGGSDFIVAIPTGSNSKYGNAKEWAQDVRTGTIPAGARKARVLIVATSVGGAPDGYVDVVSLDVADASLSLPTVISAVPSDNASGVGPEVQIRVLIEDRVTAVDPFTIQMYLDDRVVAPEIEKLPNSNTSIAFNTGVLPALSAHTYRIVYTDLGTPKVTQTNSFRFTVADYLTLPVALRVPLGSEDSTKPGFNAWAYQVDPGEPSDPPPVQQTLPASIAFSESVLAGLVGSNIADLSGAAATNRFDVPGVVNWINGTGVSANFPDDGAFPGIPGTTGSENNFVHDLVTYIRFPQSGYYQLGVNSEDHFRLTASLAGVQTLKISGSTNFVIPCVPIATNITQLQFGGALPSTPLSASVVYATPSGDPDAACSLGETSGLAGKIVLLDRNTGGACSSADKARQAQQAGAVAVLEITPGDTGYPFRLDDIDPGVGIPVLVIAENFGGAELKALLGGASAVTATIQTDVSPRISEWDGPKGFGAVDVTAGFAVPEPGLYPFRLVTGQGGGNANLEWFSVKSDGTRVLLNDVSNASALQAFRAVVAVVPPVFNPPTVSGDSVTLSWTGVGVLEETSALGGGWTPSSNQSNPQTIPATGIKFYRLR